MTKPGCAPCGSAKKVTSSKSAWCCETPCTQRLPQEKGQVFRLGNTSCGRTVYRTSPDISSSSFSRWGHAAELRFGEVLDLVVVVSKATTSNRAGCDAEIVADARRREDVWPRARWSLLMALPYSAIPTAVPVVLLPGAARCRPAPLLALMHPGKAS